MSSLLERLRLRPRNKFSIEQLQYLYNQLVKNAIITDNNRNLIVETLRQLAELMIWGDQHNTNFFDFFLEKNVLQYFLNILSQKTSKQIKIQLIQTLSILIENIRAETSIYYLLSNNYINELITHKFDFSDEEVLAYYISFLKTLSLKLTDSTLQFFFNESENDFPLYTEAVKFFNHRESMIRIAVRTLSLNVFKVEDDVVRRFILDKTAVPYFGNLVWFIRNQCTDLDKAGSAATLDKKALSDCAEELVDLFYYLHDIFHLGIEALNQVLSDHLLNYLFVPLFIGSLVKDNKLEDGINPKVALFLLSEVLFIFTHKPLFNALASVMAYPYLSNLHMEAIHSTQMTTSVSLPDLQKLTELTSKIAAAKNGNASTPNTPDLPVNTPKPKPVVTITPQLTQTEEKTDVENTTTAAVENSPTIADGASTQTPTDSTETTASSPAAVPEKGFVNLPDNTAGSSPLTIRFAMPQRKSSDDIADVTIPNLEEQTDSQKDSPAPQRNKQDQPKSSTHTTVRNTYRDALLSFLDDENLALSAICVLYSIIKSPVTERSFLEATGLLPYRMRRAKNLLEQLTSPELTTTAPRKPSQPQLRSSSFKPTEENPPSPNKKIDAKHLSLKMSPPSSPISSPQHDSPIRKKLFNIWKDTDNSSEHHSESDTENEARSQDTDDEHPHHNTPASSTSSLHTPTPTPTPQQPSNHQSITVVLSQQNTLPETKFLELDKVSEACQKEIVDRLLNLIAKAPVHHLLTLQMASLLLKELVYTPDSPPAMTQDQLKHIEEGYNNCVCYLKDKMTGPARDVALDVFEDVIRTYRQVNFESLVTDCSLLHPHTPRPVPATIRKKQVPIEEVEELRRMVECFLATRELKYTLEREKDDCLPLVDDPPLLQLRSGDDFNIEHLRSFACNEPLANNKRKKRVLMVQNQMVLVLDGESVKQTSRKPDPTTSPKKGVWLQVIRCSPLQYTEVEEIAEYAPKRALKVDDLVSGWSVVVIFDEECVTLKDAMLSGKDAARKSKIRQISNILGLNSESNESVPVSVPHLTRKTTADAALLSSLKATSIRMSVSLTPNDDPLRSHSLHTADDDGDDDLKVAPKRVSSAPAIPHLHPKAGLSKFTPSESITNSTEISIADVEAQAAGADPEEKLDEKHFTILGDSSDSEHTSQPTTL